MAKYAVSEEGVQALKLVALKVIEGTEEIKEETVRMTLIADQYRDTLGPHRDELENVLMEIKGALGRHGLKRQNNIRPERVREERASRLVSSSKLIDRLGIRRYVKDNVEKVDTVFSPKTVYIELKQHVGKPASPTVKEGDSVTRGRIVAATDYNDLGTCMHASIDGMVTKVTDRYVMIAR